MDEGISSIQDVFLLNVRQQVLPAAFFSSAAMRLMQADRLRGHIKIFYFSSGRLGKQFSG